MIEGECQNRSMRSVLDLLFPVKCPLCGAVLSRNEKGVCDVCRPGLPVVTEPCCKHCGKPLACLEQEYCPDCSDRDSALEQGTALWVYTDDMKKAIADFKYEGCLADGKFYGMELLAGKWELLQLWKPDCIVPVPLHWRKRWSRGYNQAACVAEVIGEGTGTPVIEDALLRTRYTSPQKGLDHRRRRDNLRDAFIVNPSRKDELSLYRRVLMVDDIYTTGATLEACGSTLRNDGVEKVYFICLCIGSAC